MPRRLWAGLALIDRLTARLSLGRAGLVRHFVVGCRTKDAEGSGRASKNYLLVLTLICNPKMTVSWEKALQALLPATAQDMIVVKNQFPKISPGILLRVRSLDLKFPVLDTNGRLAKRNLG